jgi:hypothetical protein
MNVVNNTADGENYFTVCTLHHIINRVIKSERMKEAGHVKLTGAKRNAYKISVVKPQGRRPRGAARCIWDDNIQMNIKDTGCEDEGWIQTAQDWVQWRALVNKDSIKRGEFVE